MNHNKNCGAVADSIGTEPTSTFYFASANAEAAERLEQPAARRKGAQVVFCAAWSHIVPHKPGINRACCSIGIACLLYMPRDSAMGRPSFVSLCTCADKHMKCVCVVCAQNDEANSGCNCNCARADAKPGKKCDIEGVVGATCPHVVPARGCMIQMRTPEQFMYYDVLLEELARERPDLEVVYFDLACK